MSSSLIVRPKVIRDSYITNWQKLGPENPTFHWMFSHIVTVVCLVLLQNWKSGDLMIIYFEAYSPSVDPLPSWLWKKKWSELKKFLQIGWKSLSKKPMGSRSSLHEHFVRVKTLMGLQLFEVEKNCPPNSHSLGIY